jgi:hypothetical protein
LSQLWILPPQFDTAEYAGVAGTERCAICKQLVADQYYRVNSLMACSSCADRAKHELPKDSHSAYMRALMYGVGAAVIGMILYSAVGIITGLNIGYVSLAVGYLVGKGMKKGSNNVGGKKYQISAALLTYAAVSLAAVPIALWQIKDTRPAKSVQTHQQVKEIAPAATPESAPAASSDGAPASPEAASEKPADTVPEKKPMTLGSALLTLAFLGLASPFLELQNSFHGVIGLVILSVGMRFAWQATAGTETVIDGPYDNRKPATIAASVGGSSLGG